MRSLARGLFVFEFELVIARISLKVLSALALALSGIGDAMNLAGDLRRRVDLMDARDLSH